MKRNLIVPLSLCAWLQAQGLAQSWLSYTNINPVRQLLAEGQALWAATEGGVVSFSAGDTVLIDVFTNVDGLPSTDVACAGLGSHGRLYFGTASSGAAVLDSSRTRFTRITTRDQNIISDSINAVLCQGSYVFLGSPGGLSFFDGGVWQTYSDRQFPMGPSVLSLAWRSDSLFIGTGQGLTAAPLAGLTGRIPSLWRRYANAGIGDSSIHCLLATDTALLAGTSRGLAHLYGGSWSELANLGRRVNGIQSLGDTICLATINGAWRFAGGAAAEFSSGLPSLDVRSFTLADDSALWAGTSEGLARWEGDSWRPFRQKCIPDNLVNRVAAGGDGSVWLAHWSEFASRIRPNGEIVTYPNPVPGIPAHSLAVDALGCAWYGMAYWDSSLRSYIVRIDPGDSDTLITSPPLPQRLGIWDAFVGGDGLLYFAGYSHEATNYIVVLRPDGTLDTLLVDPAQSAYMNPISVARDAWGAVWVGSYSNNLARYDPANRSWSYFGTETGLSNTRIYDIVPESSGLMWLASVEGLNSCRYDPATSSLADLSVFRNPGSPLLGNDVRAVAVDRSGNRWIATDAGLSMLSWDGKWTGFTAGDALANGSKLLSDDVRQVSVRFRDASGDDILIATARGLSIYRHSATDPGAPPAAWVAPNPFRPTRDRQLMFANLPDRAAISLHALDGRFLASWQGPAAPAHVLYLDASTIPGGLPSGLYLIVVRPLSGKAQVAKLAVVR